jgi:valyl-tRNA synthetase
VTAVLTDVRKAKSEAQVSMRTPVSVLTVADSSDQLDLVRAGLLDLQQAAKAEEVEFVVADEPSVRAHLAEG